jgi:hypothetical protein
MVADKNIFDDIEKRNKNEKIEDQKEADMALKIRNKKPPNKSISKKQKIRCNTTKL